MIALANLEPRLETPAYEAVEWMEPRWYVAYTMPRHEKKAAAELERRQAEAYLPLYRAVHRWNGRRAEVELPLFPGYLFVHIPYADRLRVLTVPGILRFLQCGGLPQAMTEGEIAALRNVLALRHAEPCPFLVPKRRITIRSGPLAGLSGTIVRRKGAMRLIVSVDSIARAMLVDLEMGDVELAA